jgi:undecaprenyl-diphosphatase
VLALVQAFDLAALHATIAAIDAVPFLGSLLARILDLYLIKTALPMTLLWLLWLSPSGRVAERFGVMAASLAGLATALFLGRAGQLLLPARLRPVSDPAIAASLPLPSLGAVFDGWSSFPSDHATLAGAMIAAAFAVSRAAGIGLALWLSLLSLLPRLYLGVHWWSDVIAGLLLGLGATALLLRVGLPERLIAALRALTERAPALALAALFLISFEIATLFNGTRGLGKGAAALAAKLATG